MSHNRGYGALAMRPPAPAEGQPEHGPRAYPGARTAEGPSSPVAGARSAHPSCASQTGSARAIFLTKMAPVHRVETGTVGGINGNNILD